jgi:hypothetical protein
MSPAFARLDTPIASHMELAVDALTRQNRSCRKL